MDGMERWYVQRIIIDNSSSEILYAASEDDAYITSDGGKSWSALNVGVPEILEIVQHPKDRKILLVGTEDFGIYISHNGGETWFAGKNIPETAIYAIAFSPDGQKIYAGGYQTGLLVSNDSGITWEKIRGIDETDAIYAITVHPDDNKYIVVGTNGKGLFESFDGGKTWQHAGLYGAHIQQIKFVPEY